PVRLVRGPREDDHPELLNLRGFEPPRSRALLELAWRPPKAVREHRVCLPRSAGQRHHTGSPGRFPTHEADRTGWQTERRVGGSPPGGGAELGRWGVAPQSRWV